LEVKAGSTKRQFLYPNHTPAAAWNRRPLNYSKPISDMKITSRSKFGRQLSAFDTAFGGEHADDLLKWFLSEFFSSVTLIARISSYRSRSYRLVA
jgi:hypothetical protein